ncbi:MAG TPA: STAS domain-containing protein [Candidatus Hydrogenedentes bacterium]|nr:STAS domain-containing protein [Candidatus Hydrogenedentota bacterium]
MLNITRAEHAKVIVLRLVGLVNDAASYEMVRTAIHACLQQGHHHLVLNFKSLEFIDNAGFGVVIEDLGRFRSLHGDIKLAEVSVHGERLLRMMGLLRVFDIYKIESAAIRGYQREAA